jgi:GntR family transcriptional regulator, carbon starvation induced regulator
MQDGPGLPTTRGEWVEVQLADAILSGELVPGQRLLAADLTRQLGVSLTPLREGLQRLAGRGLVELDPQRGARVAEISASDAHELYELRLLLEPIALRASVPNLTPRHHKELTEAFAEYERQRTSSEPDKARIAAAHRRFHDLLISGCPSVRMRSLVLMLGDHARRYAALTVEDPASHRDPVGEHRELLEAALAGDTDACCEALVRHLRVGLVWAERLEHADRSADTIEPTLTSA